MGESKEPCNATVTFNIAYYSCSFMKCRGFKSTHNKCEVHFHLNINRHMYYGVYFITIRAETNYLNSLGICWLCWYSIQLYNDL